MPNILTNIYKNLATGGDISLSGDTFYCCLLDSTIADFDTSAIQAMTSYADVSAIEISGTGYSIGGEQLANLSLSADSVLNKTIWKSDNVSWSDATFTARGCAFYKSGNIPLIGISIFDSDLTVTNSSFNLRFTNGIMNIN